MDMTPHPPRFCFLHPQILSPSPIVGAPPAVTSPGVVCGSQCPLFIVFTDPRGKPVDGKCSITAAAITLLQMARPVADAGNHPPAGMTKQ